MSNQENGLFPDPEQSRIPNPNYVEYIEPPPDTPTLPTRTYNIGPITIQPAVIPAALRYDVASGSVLKMRVGDDEVDYRYDIPGQFSILPIVGNAVAQVSSDSFVRDVDSIEPALLSEATAIKPLALLKGYVPRIFELTRIPRGIRELRSHPDSLSPIEVTHIDWVTPGFAIEPLERCLDRFADESGLTKAKFDVLARLNPGTKRSHLELWGENLPCDELAQLPIEDVVKFLDYARSTDKTQTIIAGDYRAKSLAVRSRLQQAARLVDTKTSEKAQNAKNLTDIWAALPPEMQTALQSSQVKRLAATRIADLLKLTGFAVFVDESAIKAPDGIKAMLEHAQREVNKGFILPDLSDTQVISNILRFGLLAYPLPEPTISDNQLFSDSYFRLQEDVLYESLRMIGITDK